MKNAGNQLRALLRPLLTSLRPIGDRRRRARSAYAAAEQRIEQLEIRSLLSGVTGGLPSVVLTKGIVASTDPTAVFDSPTGPSTIVFGKPETSDQPFSGTITSELIRTGTVPQPLNANLTNANPGDRVRIAVLLENQASNGTAFDVTLRDSVSPGVSYIANSLQIVDGTGAEIAFRDLTGATDGSGLFSSGIMLDDPGATDGSFADPDHCGALDALSVANPGRNVAIAFYDVAVLNLAGSTVVFSSDATLTGYSQTEGGANLATSATDGAGITLERIDLEITKLVSNPSPLNGDVVTWTINVSNNAANATSAASGVIIRDNIPSGQNVVNGSAVFPGGGSFDQTTGVWTVGQLIAPGGSAELTFQTIAANSVEFATPLVDVQLSGTVTNTTISEGGTLSHAITVTNNSEAATSSATGIVVGNLLPAGLTYVTHSTASGTFNSSTGTWDLATVTLAAGQSATINLTTTAAAGTAGTSIGIAAQVTSLNETDVDSVANNASTTEDDDFTQTINVRAAAGTRTISGRAFSDTDNNGTIGAEAGVASITVNAYAPDGTLTGTAITDAGGAYTINSVTTEAVRLEFVGFNTTQSVTTAQSPPASISTFSSLAFLDAGTTNLTANLAMYQPTSRALYSTTCFVYSGQSTLDPTVEPALIAFNADGTVKTALATIAQVGATNGLAIHSFSGDQFVAAFQKRHADMGPSGNSAIYRIDESSGAVSTFIRLDDFFGADSTGVYSHNPLDWFTDAPALTAVGVTSFGDVDISEDGQFLYTINLATRELVQIPIGSGGTNTPVDYAVGDTRSIQRFSILGDDTTLPTNGGIATGQLGADPTNNIRPFALAMKNGLIYVGMVNTGQSTANDDDMFAYVYTFNPATGQFASTASTAFNLNTRTLGGGWQSWTDNWDDLPKFYDSSGDYFTVGHNQPWLTDIEFDSNDDMILGFRDRTGDQVGHMVGDPTGADTDSNGSPDLFYHDTKGEILHLRKTDDATWTVEVSHTAGDGTEYFVGDAANFEALASTLHPEAAQGGLTYVPGFNDVVTTAIDPQSYWAGGTIWLDSATGAQTDQLDLFSGSEVADIVSFGKNNGLGDLEYLNNLSMEIGNRVWNDIDKDGVQDAGEAGLPNIDLQLFDVSNPSVPQLVGSVTTNAAGEYYFNDSNVTYADGADPTGLRALTNYEIRAAATEFQSNGTLDQFRITASNQSPVLTPTTVQNVSGPAEFDSDLDLTADTARTQRIDILTATGLAADGVQIVISNATGGFAHVENDQTVVFEFSNGSVAGNFEYTIVDDRLDSDAVGFDDNGDGMTDRAIITFTSGATGTSDHSFDLGFARAKVDLELSKLSDRKLAVEGETVTFVITVTNNKLTAETAAGGVTVTDVIPTGLTFSPASVVASQGTFDGTIWILPNSIAIGESATLQYQATVNTGTTGSVLVNSAQVSSLNETDIDSIANNDNGDRSEDDEDDAIVLVGTLTSTTTTNRAQVSAANEPDFDSSPDNDDHDQSEDDESTASFTLSTATNIFDFGDLPDTYLTLSASGGPSHRRGTATFLGTSIDDESDGQPSTTAVGDGLDDDGVRFLTPLLPGTSASVEIVTSTAGFLNAWIDFNADGVLDEITVTTIDGTTLATPVTAADLALTAGTHTLSVSVPSTAAGLMAARFRYTNDQMEALRSPGGVWLNGEVEDYMLRQIGDRVWFDHNVDGVFDAGTEAGLAGVTVVLSADLDGDGTAETYPTITDTNGFYRFDGLPQGTYRVTVSPPASLVATFDLDAANDGTASVTLGSTTTQRFDVDFGYRGVALIGDTVWIDANANGTIDTGESGISAVAVQLTGDLNGDTVTDITLNSTTNANGNYEFQNLVAGNYTVTVTPPTGVVPTFDADNISTPNTSTTSLSIATVNRAQDFGYRTTTGSGSSGLIGDTVWLDTNGNGVQDSGESGIGDVSVQLTGDTNGDSVVDVSLSTSTTALGTYEFTNLAAGTYAIAVAPPTGLTQTFDADGTTTANTSSVTLATGDTNRNQDFGYRATVVTPTGVDLLISKDNIRADDRAAVSGVVTYTITVSNAGPDDATVAAVADTLPTQFITATWTAAGSIGTTFTASGTGSISETVSLPAGASITYTVEAQLNATFTGTISNTATVSTSQTELDVTNNSATDVTTVTPITLTPHGPALPGQPFEISSSGMSHVALVPFIVGTTPGPGVINDIPVDIADPQVFMIGFVCVDDRITAVYDIPAHLEGQTLYFQSYEATPTPRLSNVVQATVGGPRVVIAESGGVSTVTEGSTTDTVSVVLSEAPASDVIVEVQSQTPTRVTATPATVTFTSANWNLPQTVSLQAVDDTAANGDVTATIDVSVQTGSDTGFAASFAQSIDVLVTDNDVLQRPGLTNSFTTTQDQQPTITWSAVAGANSYDLWISPAGDTASPVYDINVVGTTFTPPTPLGVGRYNVWVRAKTTAGELSAWSAGVRVDIKTSPVLNAVPDSTNRRPTFSWNAVNGATTYEVWVNNQTTGTSKVAYNVNIATTSFTPAEDLSFGIHAVWVRAIDKSGFAGQWSVAESFDVGIELLSPIQPTFSNQPTFTWKALPGASQYEIYLQTGSTVIRQSGITDASWTPPTTLADGVYRWWIRGTAANGKSGRWSGSAVTTIGGRPTVLAPAQSGVISSASPTFSWTAVDGAAMYALYVGRVDVPGLAFRNDTLTTTSYTHSSGLAAGAYRVWVRAISTAGTRSAWSAPILFTVAAVDSEREPESLLMEFADTLVEDGTPRSPNTEQRSLSADMTPGTGEELLRHVPVKTANESELEFAMLDEVLTLMHAATDPYPAVVSDEKEKVQEPPGTPGTNNCV